MLINVIVLYIFPHLSGTEHVLLAPNEYCPVHKSTVLGILLVLSRCRPGLEKPSLLSFSFAVELLGDVVRLTMLLQKPHLQKPSFACALCSL